MAYGYTAAVTLLALLVYLAVSFMAGQARGKYGIKAPATIGHEGFERAYRVQMNTLEQLVFFLPALWLYALFMSDKGAAVGGLVWVVGRIVYSFSYTRSPASRAPGFVIAMLAQVGLFLGAAYGVARTFF